MDVFIGTIVPWPITYAPPYFAFCQGQEYQVSQYQAVYSLIGNLFGGSGTVSFKLPDLRGRVVLGAGNYLGGVPVFNIGQTGGSFTTAALIQSSMLPLHTHAASFVPTVGPQTVTIPAVPASGSLSVSVGGGINTTTAGVAAPASGADVYLGGLLTKSGPTNLPTTGPYNATQAPTTANLKGLTGTVTPSTGYNPGVPAATLAINTVNGGMVSVAPGGGAAIQAPFVTSQVQPYLAMNFLFCLQGLYPMRP